MNADTLSPGSNTTFHKLLGLGLVVWLLAQVALVGVGRWAVGQATLLGALDWAVSHAWIAFLAGLLGLLVCASRFPGGLGRALVAYVLPLGVFGIASGVCFLLYPDHWFLTEMLGFVPSVWMFGLLGWAWLKLKSDIPPKEAMIRTVLPPILGGIAVLLGVVVPTFQSNAFQYRNAFAVTLTKTTFADGKLAADAVLDIRKPGDYRFKAVRYTLLNMADAEDQAADNETGRIEWTTAGAPAAATTGAFPMTIRWDKSPPPNHSVDELLGEDCITLVVSTSAEPDTVIRSISVPLMKQ